MSRPTGFSLVVRALVRDRAKDFNDSYAVCEILAICQGTAAEAVHHRRARGAGGSRRASTNLPANGLATCNRCHEWVESNREKSRGFGWLLLQNQTPSEVPVLRRGVFVLLDNDGGFRPVAVGVDPNPKTIPDQLDAAESGEEFGQVLLGLFGALDRAREAEEL